MTYARCSACRGLIRWNATLKKWIHTQKEFDHVPDNPPPEGYDIVTTCF